MYITHLTSITKYFDYNPLFSKFPSAFFKRKFKESLREVMELVSKQALG